MLPKYQTLKQMLSDFRSEALMGRYPNALKLCQRFQALCRDLNTQSQPDTKSRLLELEALVAKEKALVLQLSQSYPAPSKVQPPSVTVTQALRESGATSKWSKKQSSKSEFQGDTRLGKSDIFLLTEEQKMYYQHLIDQTGDSSAIPLDQYVGQESAKQVFQADILPPFKLPKFYSRLTTPVVLLLGHPLSGKATLLKSMAKDASLQYLNVNLTQVPLNIVQDIKTFLRQLLRKKQNHIFHFSRVHQCSELVQDTLMELCQSHAKHPSRNLVVLSTCKPELLPQQFVTVFTSTICLQQPNRERRLRLIGLASSNRLNNQKMAQLADLTGNVSSGNITYMVQQFIRTGTTPKVKMADRFDSEISSHLDSGSGN